MKSKDRQFIFGILLMLNSILQYYLWFGYKMPPVSMISCILFSVVGSFLCIRTFKD